MKVLVVIEHTMHMYFLLLQKVPVLQSNFSLDKLKCFPYKSLGLTSDSSWEQGPSVWIALQD